MAIKIAVACMCIMFGILFSFYAYVVLFVNTGAKLSLYFYVFVYFVSPSLPTHVRHLPFLFLYCVA
jgi:hypothetical protein